MRQLSVAKSVDFADAAPNSEQALTPVQLELRVDCVDAAETAGEDLNVPEPAHSLVDDRQGLEFTMSGADQR